MNVDIKELRSRMAHYLRRWVKDISVFLPGLESCQIVRMLKEILKTFLRKLPCRYKIILLKTANFLYYYDQGYKYYAGGNIKRLTENAIKNFTKGEVCKGEKLINGIFNNIIKNLPYDYKHILKDAVYRLLHLEFDGAYYEKMQGQIINRTDELDASSLETEKWLDLQYLCIRIGMFRASAVFRKKAVEKAFIVFEENKGVNDIVNAFSAAIDCSDFDYAKHILGKYRSFACEEDYNKMHFYYSLFSKNSHEGLSQVKQNLSGIELDFLNYVSNKTVALIGPAQCNDLTKGSEIDSFDIVVRNGYRGDKYLPEFRIFGSRTDVAYYGVANALQVLCKNTDFLSHLEWVVFKSENFLEAIDGIHKNRRRCFETNNYYFCGSPMMIQNIIFDVIHFRPEKIKLFNVNFYLSENTHYKEYYLNIDRNSFIKNTDDRYCKLWANQKFSTGGFSHHDMLSQLNFVRNLWLRKRIQVDPECSKVLEMSNEEYLKAMERIYVTPHLIEKNESY